MTKNTDALAAVVNVPPTFPDDYAKIFIGSTDLVGFNSTACFQPFKKAGSPKCTISAGSRGDVSIAASYDVPNYPVNVSMRVSPLEKAFSKWLPTIAYTFGYKGCNITARADLVNKTIGAQVNDPAYTASISTKVLDGLASEVAISTRLVDETLGGLSFSYDPSRSGLKSFQYALLLQNRKEIRNGDAQLSYDSTKGTGISIRAPVSKQISASVVAYPAVNEYIVGGEARCTQCNVQVSGKVDIGRQLVQLSAWKKVAEHCNVNVSLQSSTKKPFPQVGILATYE